MMDRLADNVNNEPIAIIGMACRLPKAQSVQEFWDLLMRGEDGVTTIPSDRWNKDIYHEEGKKNTGGRMPADQGGFISDVDQFDAPFFKMTRREAELMDPQQRLLLEVTYESLEDAGQDVNKLRGSDTAVYVGMGTSDYMSIQFSDPTKIKTYVQTGCTNSMVANRVSYFFDFRGPSMVIETACSSSLIALHQACQSIHTGEASLAIVAGTSMNLIPHNFIGFGKMTMLSPDGRCFAFDERANGYVRSEGILSLVLKPLSKAIADNDPVHAIIAASGTNQDGCTPGITTPGREAQENLILQLYKKANLDRADTQYIEAHGTGTPVGDKIECEAIANVLGKERSSDRPLIIGSVKSNIGHLEAASGLAGVVKAVLSIKNNLIPSNLHFRNPNPKIPFQQWNLSVACNPAGTPWPQYGSKASDGSIIRRASVNSFGFGGSNAHAILESFHPTTTATTTEIQQDGRAYVFPLSADTKTATEQLINKYITMLTDKKHAEINDPSFLANLSYTLSCRRTHHNNRATVIASTIDELLAQLQNASRSIAKVETGAAPKIGFVFTGQGAQWYAMGRQLMKSEPVFAEYIHKCAEVVTKLGASWSLLEELLERDEKTSKINSTDYSQPCCCAVQIALVELWRSWGVTPTVVVGHSSGEMAAAYAAGALSLDEAMAAAYYRGVYMIKAAGQGKMCAVGLSEADAIKFINSNEEYKGRVHIAAVNSPTNVTLSGDTEPIEAIAKKLPESNITARMLMTSSAFHSPHMYPYADPLRDSLKDLLKPKEFHPGVSMVSTVTGEPIQSSDAPKVLVADYWSTNMCQTVRFVDAMVKMLRDYQVDVLIEVGNHPALQGPTRQIVSYVQQSQTEKKSIPVLASIMRKEDERKVLLTTLITLFSMGYAVQFAGLFNNKKLRVLQGLPSYPWQHDRYWFEPVKFFNIRFRETPHELLGSRVISSVLPMWENEISVEHIPYLNDHRIQGSIVFPAAGYIEMALAAAKKMIQGSSAGHVLRLEDVQFMRALVFDDAKTEVRTNLTLSAISSTAASSRFQFTICSQPASQVSGAWQEHCKGFVVIIRDEDTEQQASLAPAETGAKALDKRQLYESLKNAGYEYGPYFQCVDDLQTKQQNAKCSLRMPSGIISSNIDTEYILHPTLLDSSFHILLAASDISALSAQNGSYLPTGVKYLQVKLDAAKNSRGESPVFEASAKLQKVTNKVISGSLSIGIRGTTTTVVTIDSLQCSAIGKNSSSKGGFQVKWNEHLYVDRFVVDFDLSTKLFPTEGNFSEAITVPEGATTNDVILSVADHILHKGNLVPSTRGGDAPTPSVVRVLDNTADDGATAVGIFAKLAELTVAYVEIEYVVARQSESELEAIRGRLVAQSEAPAKLQFVVSSELVSVAPFDLVLIAEEAAAECVQAASKLLKPQGHLLFSSKNEDTKSILASANFDRVDRFANTYMATAKPAFVPTFKPETSSWVITTPNNPAIAQDMSKVLSAAGERVDADIKSTNAAIGVFFAGFDNQDNDDFFPAVKEHVITIFRDFLDHCSRVFLVTRSALYNAKSDTSAPMHTPYIGLVRVLQNERQDIKFSIVDVDDSVSANTLYALFKYQQLNQQRREGEIVLRKGYVLVPRLLPLSELEENDFQRNEVVALSDPRSIKVEIGTPGLLNTLRFVERQNDDDLVNAGEDAESNIVEIDVMATGLNFKDIMNSMGMLSEEAVEGGYAGATLGLECSGVVKSVGAKVTHLKPGDRVTCMARGCMSNRVRSLAAYTFKIPDNMSFEEAATLPVTFLTVYYSLHQLAQLEAGESILIHAATGGVGQAAVQIAKLKGAEVYATCGSAEKSKFLQEHLGVKAENIMSSRNTKFAEQIMRKTNGRGVDVVLNSLAGELLKQSVTVLAPGGRFVEIGKRDIYANSQLDMKPLGMNLSFFAFDLDRALCLKRNLVSKLFKELMELFQQGLLKPLPYYAFPITQIEDAFRMMQAGKHIGKIVLTQPDKSVKISMVPSPKIFRGDRSYLLVGGLGGFGCAVAKWMASRGAGSLVFLTRPKANATLSEDAAKTVDHLVASGVKVTIVRSDGTDLAHLEKSLFEGENASLPPFAGVLHMAMVLDDHYFKDTNRDRFQTAVTPKINTALNLHKLFLNKSINLEFFILFSSAVSQFGNLGQANYAAANAFLDALAAYRQRLGLAATSINWGSIGDVGVVSRNKELEQSITRRGWFPLPIVECFKILEFTLRNQHNPRYNTRFMAAPMSWKTAAAFMPILADTARFANVINKDDQIRRQQQDGASSSSNQRKISASSSPQEKAAYMLDAMTKKLASMLGLANAEDVDPKRPLSELGIDSLTAVEFKNWIDQELGELSSAQISLLDITGGNKSVSSLVAKLAAAPANTTAASINDSAAASENQSQAPTPAPAPAPAPAKTTVTTPAAAAPAATTTTTTTVPALTAKPSSKTDPVFYNDLQNLKLELGSDLPVLTPEERQKLMMFRNDCSVLLTGATGYLGVYLLEKLLRTTDCHIYCLVRAKPQQGSLLDRIKSAWEKHELVFDDALFAPRITCVEGDLAKPLLGLSETQFEDLAHRVDVIFHNGAMVNWVYPYEALRSHNVLGTLAILRLASTKKLKPVHFVGSIIATSHAKQTPEDKFDDIDDLIEEIGSPVGYLTSKWLAERFVRQAAQQGGVPVSIYRPCFITGHSKSGVSNQGDFINRYIRGVIELGAAIDMDTPCIDFSPVDFVADLIVSVVKSNDWCTTTTTTTNDEATTIRTYNVVNCGNYISYRKFASFISQAGRAIFANNNAAATSDASSSVAARLFAGDNKLKPMEYLQWQALLRKNAASNSLYPLLGCFPDENGKATALDMIYPRKYNTSNTDAFLATKGAEFALSWPSVDLELIQTYLASLAKRKLI